MLKKSNISSSEPNSEEWLKDRLTYFTSSKISELCKQKGIGKTGMKYVYKCVGEELSGVVLEKELLTSSIAHGNMYEIEAIRASIPTILSELGLSEKIDFVVLGKFIRHDDGRNGSTPDLMIPIEEHEHHYKVYTVECKCPETYEAYISLSLCQSPEHLKKENDDYYWQVIHQMYVSGAEKGYLCAYHPFIKIGGVHIIEFDRASMTDEFEFLEERIEQAKDIYNDTREYLINKKKKY